MTAAPDTTERPERQERQAASDEVTEVATGVYRLQLPISLPGLGHVNCYAFEDPNGFTVVDPGLPDPDSFVALQHRLSQLGATPANIHTVLVTHSHPDHFGGAGRLRLVAGAEVIAHEHFRSIFDPREDDAAELLDVRAPKIDMNGFDPADFATYLLGDDHIPEIPGRRTTWGGEIPFLSRDEIRHMRTWDDVTKRGFLTPSPDRRVADADHVTLAGREWRAIFTPGHTGDHLCLFDPTEGILLTGDHVLPTITPHISGLALSADALADFFDALDKVASIEGVRLALPAHGHPFTDVAGRTAAIRQHHAERLEVLREIARGEGELDVIEFSHHLFQERSWGAMAESETYAHLEHMRLTGEAHSRREGTRLLYDLHV